MFKHLQSLKIAWGLTPLIVCWFWAGNIDFLMAAENEKIQTLENEVSDLKKTVESLSKPREHNDFDIPKLNLQGFGHFQYDFDSRRTKDSTGAVTSDTQNNFFNTGGAAGMDLIITSQIARKFSFLNETMLESTNTGATDVDVERFLAKYEHADWLSISMGRGHTGLGYWNQRFHHGIWMITTTQRPLIYRFEDEGGILPVHFVGVQFNGNFDLNLGNISYIGNVANGRGRTTNDIQLIKDDNNNKQVNLMFTVEPNAFKGLGFGANLLYDVIPPNPGMPGRSNSINETIGGVHAYYLDDKIELIGEYQTINHNAVNRKFHTGGYAQFAYTLGKIKPYYRFDILNIESGDAFFQDVNDAIDSKQHTLGIRYDFFPYAALKLEYRHLKTDILESNATTAQISFAF